MGRITFESIKPVFVLALLLGLASCSSQPVTVKEFDPPAAPSTPYVIGPDDQLSVIVWKQQQLSGDVTVASDGTITVPLLGSVKAAGLTCDQLAKNLTKGLAAYTKAPNVTVKVVAPNSRIFYVLGQVRAPGAYPLHSGERLAQALAQAGGLSEFADASKIHVLRRTAAGGSDITVDFHQVLTGTSASADIPIEAHDTITVP